ncbi:MAG: hypothetical protein ACM3PY_02650 [Omnitrophica WOR_2 bacterium]
MDTTLIIALAVLAVFLILALVALFRFDSVKNTFEGLGFKMGISGTKRKASTSTKSSQILTEERSDRTQDATGGSAAVTIGGKVTDSLVSASGSEKGRIKVEEDVKKSDLISSGRKSAQADIGGDVIDSSIDVKSKK